MAATAAKEGWTSGGHPSLPLCAQPPSICILWLKRKQLQPEEYSIPLKMFRIFCKSSHLVGTWADGRTSCCCIYGTFMYFCQQLYRKQFLGMPYQRSVEKSGSRSCTCISGVAWGCHMRLHRRKMPSLKEARWKFAVIKPQSPCHSIFRCLCKVCHEVFMSWEN